MELSYLLDIVSAFLLGMFVLERIVFYKIRRILTKAGVDFTEGPKVEVIKVKKYFIENINGLLYLYEHTTNKFISQGKTLEELAILTKNDGIAGVSYNEQLLWFVDGEVKTAI
jgi:hypothetical protein